MKKLLVTLIISSLFVAPSWAAKIGVDADVTTMPDLYFLKSSQSFDSYELLPPPPAADSIGFLLDKTIYEQGKLLRSTERGKQAYNCSAQP